MANIDKIVKVALENGETTEKPIKLFADIHADVDIECLNTLPDDWTCYMDLNPRKVDDSSFIPRSKIIERALASGHVLELFRQSDEYKQSFDIAHEHDNMSFEDEVMYMQRDEIEQRLIEMNSRLEELQSVSLNAGTQSVEKVSTVSISETDKVDTEKNTDNKA